MDEPHVQSKLVKDRQDLRVARIINNKEKKYRKKSSSRTNQEQRCKKGIHVFKQIGIGKNLMKCLHCPVKRTKKWRN